MVLFNCRWLNLLYNMASKVTLYYVKPGGGSVPITLPQLPGTSVREREYPSKFFKTNGVKKPSITLCKDTLSMDHLRSVVTAGIASANLRVEHATLFLYHYSKDLKGVLQEDWYSYGVAIGKKDDELTPWSLVEVKFSDEEPPAAAARDITPLPDSALFGYILFIYRALTVKDQGTAQYRLNVHSRLATVMKAAPFFAPTADFSGASQSYSSWYGDTTYLAMVAALDMFLVRFPGNVMSSARIGTISSRYKDCAVYSSLGRLMRATGLPLKEIYKWMMVRAVATEAKALIEVEEEMDMEYSYAPYLSDFKLVTKSPYSVASNPTLHMWIHTLGSLLLSERSLNARCFGFYPLDEIVQNTMLLAYARHQQASTGQAQNIAGAPTSLDPALWCSFLAEKQFQVPPEIYSHFFKSMNGLKGLREGTIGKKIKSYLQAYGPNDS